jgi:hypothetical protein
MKFLLYTNECVLLQMQLLCAAPIELLSSGPAAATESATRSTHASNYNRQEVPEDGRSRVKVTIVESKLPRVLVQCNSLI